MKVFLYFHTLRYLKFRQITYRLLRKIKHPKKRSVSWKLASSNSSWVDFKTNKPSLFNGKVKFLNHEVSIEEGIPWNTTSFDKLWLYNLHYFDDLSADAGSQSRSQRQERFMHAWISENPFSSGNGWEAYPTSLRIVNWIKAFKSHLEPDQAMLNSLAHQADYLFQDQELHLLGNHYFVNLKALIFAGIYFDGDLPSKWLSKSWSEYERELREQILDDGANFELTPMYHSIMMVDLIDLLNLFNTYPQKVPSHLIKLTQSKLILMSKWLDNMCHVDGEISFFNDSTLGIAPSKAVIHNYAKKVVRNFSFSDVNNQQLQGKLFPDSGYVSLRSSDWVLIADLAPIGPDYIPGHGHADTLSYEFSLGMHRIFVNSGISEYGLSRERLRQRGTSAHNTVEIAGKNSSNIWSGFRVAQRATITRRHFSQDNGRIFFGAEHDGYIKQGVKTIHSRLWEVTRSSFSIVDKLSGKSERAASFLHLHPDVEVSFCSSDGVCLKVGNYVVDVLCENGELSLQESLWFPGFGISVPNKRLKIVFHANQIKTNVKWRKV